MQQPKKPPVSKYFIPLLLHMPAQRRYPQHNVQIMLIYFALQSLDVSNSLNILSQSTKTEIIDYIYSLQINKPVGGFFPSSIYTTFQQNQYQLSHVIFTYSALNSLKILGDDLKRVNRDSIVEFIKSCRREDGSFSNFAGSDECDLRFVYGAICVCSLLDDFSAIDIDRTLEYIESCYNYDGGYGLRPNCQSHSGGIYTALASLKILNKIDRINKQKKSKILHFLNCRQTFNQEDKQIVGVQGRVGKIPDSCYTFWVGASIQILTGKNLLNPGLEKFLDYCHKQNGTYSKYPFMEKGDPQHTLHSIVGLKIIKNDTSDLSLEKGIKKDKI